ncbi:unnamed protein product, partial [Prunus brigantina]
LSLSPSRTAPLPLKTADRFSPPHRQIRPPFLAAPVPKEPALHPLQVPALFRLYPPLVPPENVKKSRILRNFSGARSNASDYHFLRTWYAFLSIQWVLAAGCGI